MSSSNLSVHICEKNVKLYQSLCVFLTYLTNGFINIHSIQRNWCTSALKINIWSIHPISINVSLLQGCMGLVVPISSIHGVRNRIHHGQVTCPSQDNTDKQNKQTCTSWLQKDKIDQNLTYFVKVLLPSEII